MRSVYADTLRWRQATASTGAPGHEPAQTPPSTGRLIAVEPRLTLSEMALAVARKVREHSACADSGPPDQIIVCTTSFEHDLAHSCAGRLHSELGSRHAPFAIGQLQGASFLAALQVARAMMISDPGMRTVLIVAAERWRAPFPRSAGTLTALGDGAAAALIRRHAGAGWYIRSITVRTPASPGPAASETCRVDNASVVRVITETCTDAGLEPSAIDWILPARINALLAREISTQAGLAAERIPCVDTTGTGYLCAADTPAHLDALLHSATPSDGQHMLLWSAGFQGQAACAILEYRRS